jgi:hypothetical protein
LNYQLSVIKAICSFLIIIASIAKPESPGTRSDLSTVEAEITRERFPRALLLASADAILMTREPVSVGPRGRWTVGAVAAARSIDDRADAATLVLIHPIGMAPIGH